MPVNPVNYTQTLGPVPNLLASFQQGQLTAQQLEAQRAQAQAAKADAEQRAAVMRQLIDKPFEELSANDIYRASAVLSKDKSKALKDWADGLTKSQQERVLGESGKVMAAFEANRPDVAADILRQKAEAYRNSGDEQNAKFYEAMAKNAEENPHAAQLSIGMLTAHLPGGREVMEAIGKGDAGQYRTLSTDEKSKLGLNTAEPFQIAPDGKITKIGGGGVNVTVEGQPQVGTIPPGWQLTKRGGSFAMEPIPGGPAEQKAREVAEGKGKQGELEKRAGNVVVEDIGRLKEKIQKSPWYSPTTGISGAVASFIPGTNRVDAEELKQTIVANVGFDRLQQMRDASPTGGALGQVSERELSTLQAVLGSLSLSQSEEQLLKNLDRLNVIYKKILKKASAYPNAEEFGFGGAVESTGGFKVIRKVSQ